MQRSWVVVGFVASLALVVGCDSADAPLGSASNATAGTGTAGTGTSGTSGTSGTGTGTSGTGTGTSGTGTSGTGTSATAGATATTGTTATTSGGMLDGGATGGGVLPTCAAPTVDGVPGKACTNMADFCIVGVDAWGDTYKTIITDNTLVAPDPDGVEADILAEGVSAGCTACWKQQLVDATDLIIEGEGCTQACVFDATGMDCLICQQPSFAAFKECSGIEVPDP